MSPTLPLRILGTAAVGGARRVSSAWLDEQYGRPPGLTQARSGVVSRTWAGPGQTSSGLAAEALAAALDQAGLAAEDLDALIVASVLPEQPMPTTAALVLGRLGLGHGVTAYDVNASCLGFLVAMESAGMGLGIGRWRRVGVVAVDLASPGLNHADLESSALFGDGAAAAVLGLAEPGTGILAARFASYPAGLRLCEIAAGGTRWNATQPPPDPSDYLFRMNGLGVMRLAAQHLPGFIEGVLADAGIGRSDLDLVIPHQASGLGLRYLTERLGFGADLVVDILADHGNQVAASLPTALNEAILTRRLQRGQTALLLGTGAGLGLGAAVVRY